MGNLLPEITGCPSHRLARLVVFDHMTPAASAAFRAEQFLQPFVAQHQNWVSLAYQLRLLG